MGDGIGASEGLGDGNEEGRLDGSDVGVWVGRIEGAVGPGVALGPGVGYEHDSESALCVTFPFTTSRPFAARTRTRTRPPLADCFTASFDTRASSEIATHVSALDESTKSSKECLQGGVLTST